MAPEEQPSGQRSSLLGAVPIWPLHPLSSIPRRGMRCSSSRAPPRRPSIALRLDSTDHNSMRYLRASLIIAVVAIGSIPALANYLSLSRGSASPPPPPPTNSILPAITGPAVVGGTLVAAPGE